MSDLTAWTNELAVKLSPLTEHYRTARALAEGASNAEATEDVDPREAQELATFLANQALIRVFLALNELPGLKHLLRDGPLSDMMAALEDLARGQSPAIFRPTQNITGQLSVKLDMLKVRAAASVLMLKRSGANDAEARRLVASIFSAAGHRGKKGGSVSASTIWNWCLDCAPDRDGGIHQRHIAEMLDRIPGSLTRPAALQLVRSEAAVRL